MKTTILSSLFLISAAAQAATVTVKITPTMKFSPNPVQITAGDTIEFVNESRAPHTVTLDPKLAANPANVVMPAGADTFHSGMLAPGQTFKQDFDVEGNYQYLCTLHERMGMFGKVIVTK